MIIWHRYSLSLSLPNFFIYTLSSSAMPQRDIDQLPDEVSAKEVQRILLPYLNQQEAIQTLQSHRELQQFGSDQEMGEMTVAEQQSFIQELDDVYQESQTKVQALNFDLTSPDFEEIDHDHIEEFTDSPKFKQAMVDIPNNPVLQQMLEGQIPESIDADDSPIDTLPEWMADGEIQFEDIPDEDLRDYEIVLFPISHIVAMQKSVTTDAYEDLPTDDDEFEDLLEYCLPTEGEAVTFGSPLSTQGGEFTGYQVVSRNPNIGSSMQLKQTPNGHQIIFNIGGSPNFVQVKRFNGRYVLKNGYHRVVKLYEAGGTHVPAVLTDAEEWSDVTQSQGHFGPSVIMNERPPMVSDFLADWAESITRPASNKVIRVLQETTSIMR